jgi:hypothetical protein
MFSSNASLLLAEVGVYSCAAAVAVAFPRFHPAWLRSLGETFRGLARRRALSVVFVMGFVLIVRGMLLPVLPPPVPGVNDEFSYILGADTFASGRAANPAHPVWKSLETFYVIQHPTYASMYPPAQGLALAAGELLTKNPWAGVYLSVALMCGAICWMLQGYVPPVWALTGGLIAALRWGIFSYWMESYWGGAVAAIGGALVAGAMPRLLRAGTLRARTVWPALGLGSGLLILANSRPFEGALFSVTVMAIFLGRAFYRDAFRRKNLEFRPLLLRVALPLTVLLACGGASMGWYFWRVTGSPFTMPYQLHSAAYEVTGPFLWQPLRTPPFYRYAVMESYHMGRQTAAFLQAHTLSGWLFETWRKVESLALFYFWPAMLPVGMAIPFLWRDSRARLALAAVFVMLAGLTLEIWPMTLHYHAPMAGLMVLLLIQAMRWWTHVTWRGRPVGAAIARTVPLFCAAMLAFRLGAAVLHVPVPDHGLVPWFTVTPGNLQRAEVERHLEAQPGQHLVIVRYGATHHDDEEWVHNAASIDTSKVVWARYGTPEDNARLLEYFHNRRVWRVDVEARSYLLTQARMPPSDRIAPTLSSAISH